MCDYLCIELNMKETLAGELSGGLFVDWSVLSAVEWKFKLKINFNWELQNSKELLILNCEKLKLKKQNGGFLHFEKFLSNILTFKVLFNKIWIKISVKSWQEFIHTIQKLLNSLISSQTQNEPFPQPSM